MTSSTGIRGGRKLRDGVVVSDKMEKTIVVAVQSNIQHPIYKKTIRRVRKYMAHDENEVAKMGDRVRIAEAAPTSKRKRWDLVEVLTHVELADIAPEAIDSTLIEELAAPQEQAARAVASPEGEAAAPPSSVAAEASSDGEIEVVQEDAGIEALEPEAHSAESVLAEVPSVPPMEQEEPVQQDAPAEALEQVEREAE
jgi:small subunit ribosomal protein S17